MRTSDYFWVILVESNRKEDLRIFDHIQTASIEKITVDIDVWIGDEEQGIRTDFVLEEIEEISGLRVMRNRWRGEQQSMVGDDQLCSLLTDQLDVGSNGFKPFLWLWEFLFAGDHMREK